MEKNVMENEELSQIEEIIQKVVEDSMKKVVTEILGQIIHDYPRKKIMIKNETGITCVERIDAITAMVIDDHICQFHFENGENFQRSSCLKKLEKMLPEFFFRINKGVIINVGKIAQFHFVTRKITMGNGAEFVCAKEKVKSFRHCLAKYTQILV